MAIQVSSIEELKDTMMSIVGNAMCKAERSVKDDIKYNIQEKVYDAYTPNEYDRTGKLKDSIEADTSGYGNKVTTRVYHDVFNNSKRWYSVKSGRTIYGVPEIVSYGRYGTFVGEGYDGQYHKLIPRGTKWGQPRYYMIVGERDYMDMLGAYLEIMGYHNFTIHY